MMVSMQASQSRKRPCRSRLLPIRTICLAAALCVPCHLAISQVGSAQFANAAGLLTQMSAAFSGPVAVHKVQLSGEATWHAGSLEDAGAVSLTASDSGSAQMQLNLATTGQVTEIQTGVGSRARCQWSGADGVPHNLGPGNCWRPALWFLPALSLQPSVLSADQSLIDLGEGPVGSGGSKYRHLQGQIIPAATTTSSKALSQLIARTTSDIGIDPASYLPAVLMYSVHPNNGAPVSIAIEVHYSDYRIVNGVRIPFHIQRYVNGALQLDIRVSSATIG